MSSRHQDGASSIRLAALLVSAVCIGTLAACGSATKHPDASGSPDASPSATSVAAPSAAVSAGSTSADPTGTQLRSADPVVAGRAIFTLWNRPNLPYAQWWGALKASLSPAAREGYAGTDPSLIPVLRVTGTVTKAAKAPDVVGLSAMVYVPTNRGRFGLFLERTAPTSSWVLLRISFPPGIQ